MPKPDTFAEVVDYLNALASGAPLRGLMVLKAARLLAVVEAAAEYETWLYPNGPTTESDRYVAGLAAKKYTDALSALDAAVAREVG